jgi:hypothetical protein
VRAENPRTAFFFFRRRPQKEPTLGLLGRSIAGVKEKKEEEEKGNLRFRGSLPKFAASFNSVSG